MIARVRDVNRPRTSSTGSVTRRSRATAGAWQSTWEPVVKVMLQSPAPQVSSMSPTLKMPPGPLTAVTVKAVSAGKQLTAPQGFSGQG